ncbi:hypothetical protein J2786_001061 [Chryseobacterium vietnamense]|uniref:Uncharacterized protein n=1 Tax=Chryseobacterium vietnamense TaxID=866785 RepID=A0ACC6J4Z3_9FLAO|nr:hypothetical protein [Chryseobacterium vietnamense]MDR6457968.1 hypothetical protein [Chryseobacterium vietnamense]
MRNDKNHAVCEKVKLKLINLTFSIEIKMYSIDKTKYPQYSVVHSIGQPNLTQFSLKGDGNS